MGSEWTGRPITAEQYDATMRRHGTADWTSEDNRIMNEYQAYHSVGKYAPEAQPSDESTRDGWEQDEDAARNQVHADDRQVNAETTGNVNGEQQQLTDEEQAAEDERRNDEALAAQLGEMPQPEAEATDEAPAPSTTRKRK